MVLKTKVGMSLFPLILMCQHLFSGELLTKEAQEFVDQNSTALAEIAWTKKFDERAAQMMKDNESISSVEACAARIIFDYIADRRSKLGDAKLSLREKVEVCRYYLLYIRRGWQFPERISGLITRENYERWITTDYAQPAAGAAGAKQ